MTDVRLGQRYPIYLQLFFAEDTTNIVAKLDNSSIGTYVGNESTVFYSGIDFRPAHQQVLMMKQHFLPRDLDDLVPQIDTHNSELSLPFGIHSEVAEGHLLGDFAHTQTELPTAHDHIPLEIVDLLDPKPLNVANI